MGLDCLNIGSGGSVSNLAMVEHDTKAQVDFRYCGNWVLIGVVDWDDS